MKNLLLILLSVIMLHQAYSQNTKSVDEALGLPVAAKAPNFAAMDADSAIFELNKAIEDRPVVIIFYRGFWCPVCNKHLSQIQDSISLITDKGATVVAISPEKPKYLDKMAEKDHGHGVESGDVDVLDSIAPHAPPLLFGESPPDVSSYGFFFLFFCCKEFHWC